MAILDAGKAFELVLMDHHLGSVNGVEVIAEAKSKGLTPGAAFVLMSGRSSPETTAAARQAGASSFVDKLDFSANAAASLDRLLGLARPVAKAA